MWEVQIDGGLVGEYPTFEEAQVEANRVLPEARDNYCIVEIWHNGETVDWGEQMVCYTVEIDGVNSKIVADCLAAVCNKIRHKGKAFRVWSPNGVHLIDTKFGDAYDLVAK